MRALKTLVIAMGILIVGGIAVLVAAIANRGVEHADIGGTSRPQFDRTKITIPPGSWVVETDMDGGRLVIRLQLKDGSRRFLVIDLSSGTKIGAIDLVERDDAQSGKAGRAGNEKK